MRTDLVLMSYHTKAKLGFRFMMWLDTECTAWRRNWKMNWRTRTQFKSIYALIVREGFDDDSFSLEMLFLIFCNLTGWNHSTAHLLLTSLTGSELENLMILIRYTALDALRLISFEDEYFHCENCNGELVAESDKLAAVQGVDGDDNVRKRRHEKLKDMLQKMEVWILFFNVLYILHLVQWPKQSALWILFNFKSHSLSIISMLEELYPGYKNTRHNPMLFFETEIIKSDEMK